MKLKTMILIPVQLQEVHWDFQPTRTENIHWDFQLTRTENKKLQFFYGASTDMVWWDILLKELRWDKKYKKIQWVLAWTPNRAFKQIMVPMRFASEKNHKLDVVIHCLILILVHQGFIEQQYQCQEYLYLHWFN